MAPNIDHHIFWVKSLLKERHFTKWTFKTRGLEQGYPIPGYPGNLAEQNGAKGNTAINFNLEWGIILYSNVLFHRGYLIEAFSSAPADALLNAIPGQEFRLMQRKEKGPHSSIPPLPSIPLDQVLSVMRAGLAPFWKPNAWNIIEESTETL